jgi:aspartyl/asparaginyl-tRNA synthetase
MMLTPIFHFALEILTHPALGLFEKQAHELSESVKFRIVTRNEAIEMLEVKATYDQIVWHFGRQEAERIMAEHLNAEVVA